MATPSDDRIALISDIHGNALALRAVLEDIQRRGVSKIFCLGDVATLGPHPLECIDLVEKHCLGLICGNHDRYVLEEILSKDPHNQFPPVQQAIQWCRTKMTTEATSILEKSHPTLSIPLGHKKKVLLYHGSPRSDIEDWTEATPLETIQEVLADYKEETVFCGGHTHVCMKRQVGDDKLVVSVGSVGCPFESPPSGKPPTGPPKILASADYTILSSSSSKDDDNDEVNVEHVRLPLDTKTLIQAAKEWEHAEMGKQLASMYPVSE